MPRSIPARDATEVYVTEQGQVAIKQLDSMGNEDDIVCFDPGDIPQIVQWLQECAVDAAEIRQMNAKAPAEEEPADVR
jgi:hypothetical protein